MADGFTVTSEQLTQAKRDIDAAVGITRRIGTSVAGMAHPAVASADTATVCGREFARLGREFTMVADQMDQAARGLHTVGAQYTDTEEANRAKLTPGPAAASRIRSALG